MSLCRWSRTERLNFESSVFGQGLFHPRSLQREAEIISAFGKADPPANLCLLHTWGAPSASEQPLILVHGASRSAQYFLDPHEEGSFRDPLPETLQQAGFAVYAVTFAHNQDDNWHWCEALNGAIEMVNERHGGNSVALVGHSKGGIAARLAATPWRPSGRNIRDLSQRIDRIVLVGSPNGGLDFFFRYPSINWAFSGPENDAILNWPTSWHQIFREGEWKLLPNWYAAEPNLYLGQAQMLARWTERYPLPGKHADEEMTYEGGENERGRSLGIDEVCARTGDLVGKLRSHPTAAHVRVGLLAGTSPTIPGVLNETSGPSDGIIFVESALEFPEGAALVGLDGLPFHHKALIAEPTAQAKIVEMLKATEPMSADEASQCRASALAQGEEQLCHNGDSPRGAWTK